MASLKEVKNRINSVKSTLQITSAMKMVSSAKLHKAQNRIMRMLPFQQKLNEILAQFMGTDVPIVSPYIQEREVKRVAILALSSNNSLCGAFNANVIKEMEKVVDGYISTLGKENVMVYPIGKKVEEAAKRVHYQIVGSYQELMDKQSYVEAYELAKSLMQQFKDGEIDRVELIYYHFHSMGTQRLVHETFLPIDLNQLSKEVNEKVNEKESNGYNKDYIIEPSVEELIEDLIPKVLCQKIFTILLDSNTSEHAARMLAMQAATDNANELIQDLTKQYNKTRQQAITNELLDIIGGSLK